jgi:pimeloyl-ACP methyl ester carboxylesterase
MATTTTRGGTYVHANDTDIHYLDRGEGEPLVLLHGGLMSHGPLYADHPASYVPHLDRFAAQFRVIAPDTRGSGMTRPHPSGGASTSVLADDVAALIDALDLDRPMVCGFSEGGTTAAVLSIRHPGKVRAVVNHAGYDMLNPHAPVLQMGRVLFGGHPEATAADPDVAEQSFGQMADRQATFELLKADVDDAQGEGAWRTYIRNLFPRFVTSPGYTFDDLRSVTVPTLVLTGDRDFFCSVEEGVTTFRSLPDAELCIVPSTGHEISAAVVDATIDFLSRHQEG